MLDGGIIQRLLEEKWKTFARVSPYSKLPTNKLWAIEMLITFSSIESVSQASANSVCASLLLISVRLFSFSTW